MTREGDQVKIAPRILNDGECARIWAAVEEIEVPQCPYCDRKSKATHVVVVSTWVSYLAGQSRVAMCKAHADEAAKAINAEIRPEASK